MSVISNLKSYQGQIEILEFQNRLSNSMVKKSLNNAIKFLIAREEEGEPQEKLEKIWFNNFLSLEEFGWDFKDNEEVLSLWINLGEIIKVEKPDVKLNFIENADRIEYLIKELEQYKKAKKVFNEMPEHPIFYSTLKIIMNEIIDEIISILHNSSRIDVILNKFEEGLDRFEALDYKTTDYTFGDTVDRETVGEYYEKIMEILGIRFSRGLLWMRL